MKFTPKPFQQLPQPPKVMGKIRHGLYSLIAEAPGLHFRELQRRSKMATGQLLYHLNWMLKTSVLKTTTDGQYLRFYTLPELGAEERQVLELARQASLRHILLLLLEKGITNHEVIVKNLGLSPSTVSFHLKKLVNASIVSREVDGRKAFYSLINPETVKETLMKYRESFMDKMVDRFIDMWDE